MVVGLVDKRVLVEASTIGVVDRPLFVVSLVVYSLPILVLVSARGTCGLEVGLEARTLAVLLME